jgi:predicted nucleic acid-binding protein
VARKKVVLADASALIGLARIGGLAWLRALYRSISITRAVRAEATADRGKPGASAISSALREGWIKVLPRERLEPPLPRLDLGEASTLRAALALRPAVLVLVDDLQARREARRLGLALTGTVGIVTEARRAGLIPAARPVFERLAGQGFYVEAGLLQRVLDELGES